MQRLKLKPAAEEERRDEGGRWHTEQARDRPDGACTHAALFLPHIGHQPRHCSLAKGSRVHFANNEMSFLVRPSALLSTPRARFVAARARTYDATVMQRKVFVALVQTVIAEQPADPIAHMMTYVTTSPYRRHAIVPAVVLSLSSSSSPPDVQNPVPS